MVAVEGKITSREKTVINIKRVSPTNAKESCSRERADDGSPSSIESERIGAGRTDRADPGCLPGCCVHAVEAAERDAEKLTLRRERDVSQHDTELANDVHAFARCV